MSDNGDFVDERTVACNICAADMHEDALYCTNCRNYQSSIRRILAGIDIRSLLALIPVATLALVFIRDTLVTPEADLRIASLACQNDEVRVAAANLGNRDALFAGALIRGTNMDTPLTLKPLGETSASSLLVEAGGTRVYEFEVVDTTGKKLGLRLHSKPACQYEIKLNALAFEEQVTQPTWSCACPKT